MAQLLCPASFFAPKFAYLCPGLLSPFGARPTLLLAFSLAATRPGLELLLVQKSRSQSAAGGSQPGPNQTEILYKFLRAFGVRILFFTCY